MCIRDRENGIPVASKIMLEGGELPYADYMRLASLFPGSEVVDGTAIIREARRDVYKRQVIG